MPKAQGRIDKKDFPCPRLVALKSTAARQVLQIYLVLPWGLFAEVLTCMLQFADCPSTELLSLPVQPQAIVLKAKLGLQRRLKEVTEGLLVTSYAHQYIRLRKHAGSVNLSSHPDVMEFKIA